MLTVAKFPLYPTQSRQDCNQGDVVEREVKLVGGVRKIVMYSIDGQFPSPTPQDPDAVSTVRPPFGYTIAKSRASENDPFPVSDADCVHVEPYDKEVLESLDVAYPADQSIYLQSTKAGAQIYVVLYREKPVA